MTELSDYRRMVEKPMLAAKDAKIAGLRVETGHSEHDQYVIARARNAADKPYDQDTCRRYPWAAAARITYLEGVIAALSAGKQTP